jgi:uracil-DNA glycosylase family 4
VRTPTATCSLCPRLVDYRRDNVKAHGDWHNAPVPSFGGLDARFLIVGLAPGLRGANRTGRPFTGDWAGDLLYASLGKLGLATGTYAEHADDGLTLVGVRITNAVRCVPPANKPTPAEFKSCLPFLTDEIAAMPNLAGLFAIGRDGHEAILAALGLRKAQFPFAHGRHHRLPIGLGSDGLGPNGLGLTDSYHCSRYNTNTGRLTPEMFESALRIMLAEAPNR